MVVAAPLFNCEFTSRLPTQFIRPSGIDCTKYSRCSFTIKHIGRFFCVISSSRSFNDCNNSGNQINSHEHINGLSKTPSRNGEMKQALQNALDLFLCSHLSALIFFLYPICHFRLLFCTYRRCQPHAMCQWSVPSLLPEFVWVCYSEYLAFRVNLNSQTQMQVAQKCWKNENSRKSYEKVKAKDFW